MTYLGSRNICSCNRSYECWIFCNRGHLTLSCDYSYEESESSQLVLTWYFNESPIPIYQWVPSLDMGPQVIHEMFKDNLDLTHEADQDKFKKHSALRIINPDLRFYFLLRELQVQSFYF